MELKKELGFIALFSIASGAMISSGIFILPGLAFSHAGPAMFLSYLFAGLLALAGSLSIIELATAMPKAGGDYYFITRSLGPLVGTISGFLSWAALSLKTAFAIFGIAEVVYKLTGVNVRVSAIVVCLVFMALNIIGVKEAANFEILLVVGLLSLMALFFLFGVSSVNILRFAPFTPRGFNSIVRTAGFVFVSFGGLLKVTSVAKEVKNPKRNLPLGLIAAVMVVTIVYTLLVIITVGVLPPEQLRGSLTPIADAAATFTGNIGYVAMTIAALLAFITTANAGIMSASRYPLALSRDRLLPDMISRVHRRFQTPVTAIGITGTLIVFALFLPLETLVKAASTVILISYVLSSLSVIILRESRIQNYQPSFQAPFYPWLQILGIFVFSSLIVDMGSATVEISVSLMTIGMCMYFFYGRKKTQQEYALLHVVERITNKQLTSANLEAELRDILHGRDEIIHDHFDELVKIAPVVNLEQSVARDEFFWQIAEQFAPLIPVEINQIVTLLQERERESGTAITPYVAIPHIIIEGNHIFHILIARCQEGVRFSEEYPKFNAVFVIIGTRDERNFHLKTLAAIAQIVQNKNFEQQWLQAKTEQQLRDILLLSERKRM